MSITTLRAVATQDTKEVITHGQILGNYHEGDGYDWKEAIETEGVIDHVYVPFVGCN